MNFENFLRKAERKFGKYATENLMTLIVCSMGIVFLIDFFTNPEYEYRIGSLLAFDREAIFHGEIWRLISFIVLPPDSSALFIVFALYFYYLIGQGLERQWGAFRFNMYYLCGIIGTILSGLITGYVTNSYLNLSLFLAFAMIYPNFQVRLFFLIPIPIKYLAIVDAALLGFCFLFYSWSDKLAILFALLNIALFFGGTLIQNIKYFIRRKRHQKQMKDLRKSFPGSRK